MFLNVIAYISNAALTFFALSTFLHLFLANLLWVTMLSSLGAVLVLIANLAIYRPNSDDKVPKTLCERLQPQKLNSNASYLELSQWDWFHIIKTIGWVWPATIAKGISVVLAIYLLLPHSWLTYLSAAFLGLCFSHMQYGKLQHCVQDYITQARLETWGRNWSHKTSKKIFKRFIIHLFLLLHAIGQAIIAWYVTAKILLLLGLATIIALSISAICIVTGVSTTVLYGRSFLQQLQQSHYQKSKISKTSMAMGCLFALFKGILTFDCTLKMFCLLGLGTIGHISTAPIWVLVLASVLALSFVLTQFLHTAQRLDILFKENISPHKSTSFFQGIKLSFASNGFISRLGPNANDDTHHNQNST